MGKKRLKALEAFLLAACCALALWLVLVWLSPIDSPGPVSKKPVNAKQNTGKPERAITFERIVQKDLFRPERRKYVPPPRPKKVLLAAPPPPPKPRPPRIMLTGTALLEGGNLAILDVPGSNKQGYRVGEMIEGFAIKEIKKDSILIEKDGEAFKYSLNQPVPVAAGAGQVFNPGMPMPSITLLPK